MQAELKDRFPKRGEESEIETRMVTQPRELQQQQQQQQQQQEEQKHKRAENGRNHKKEDDTVTTTNNVVVVAAVAAAPAPAPVTCDTPLLDLLPWHTVALLATTLVLCLWQMPTIWNSLQQQQQQQKDEEHNKMYNDPVDDKDGNSSSCCFLVSVFTRRVFPEHLTVFQMAMIRIGLGGIMLLDSAWQFLFGSWDQYSEYLAEHSRLLRGIRIPFRGVYYYYYYYSSGNIFRGALTLSYFTFWVWVLEGFTFVGLGILTWTTMSDTRQSATTITTTTTTTTTTWIHRLVLLSWEIVAPTSMLVSAVVKYVLWPMAVESGNQTNIKLLQSFMTLVEHNLNFIAVIVEVTLLGGLPIRYMDLAVTPLFGVAYVLFSYAVRNEWTDEPTKHGPQFIYPFMDPTIGWWHTGSLLALLVVLILFHLAFCWLDHFLVETMGGGILTHAMAALVLCVFTCRFW